MFHNLFHRQLIPALVAAIVSTIWVIGWSQTIMQEAERGYWPALNEPEQCTQYASPQATPSHDAPPPTALSNSASASTSFH